MWYESSVSLQDRSQTNTILPAFWSKADQPRMNSVSHSWSLPVTWQIWRSHNSIRHSRKAHAARKVHSSMFSRNGVIADRSFTLQEEGFSTFVVFVTLTLTRWPSYTNYIIPSKYTACANMNFLREGFRKLSSDKHTQTNRHDQNSSYGLGQKSGLGLGLVTSGITASRWF